MYYSPVRHFTMDIATQFSCDLHVLGTPPAFILSQNQTLQRKFEKLALYYPKINRGLLLLITSKYRFLRNDTGLALTTLLQLIARFIVSSSSCYLVFKELAL